MNSLMSVSQISIQKFLLKFRIPLLKTKAPLIVFLLILICLILRIGNHPHLYDRFSRTFIDLPISTTFLCTSSIKKRQWAMRRQKIDKIISEELYFSRIWQKTKTPKLRTSINISKQNSNKSIRIQRKLFPIKKYRT